ncbi:hypothetical protein [Leisingera aquaemixtae]|uniref:hypothetical protein n=1 Tax=Leisingera aquaemixtae TaxID=1396826 RepID=UPI0021A70BED|nr:hypothetical protein [Leisingera aquaemixtae]UWQ46862.1 hypothetical protein K3719_05725 [Leisingera aquaemixtae]
MKSLKGGGWMGLIEDSRKNRLLAGLRPDETTSINTNRPEEFAARVVGNYLRVARLNIELFDLVIRHEELAPRTVQEVVTLFGLSTISNAKIRRCLSYDAKSEHKTPYVANCEAGTSTFELAVEREVEKHAIPEFCELMLSISQKCRK